MSEIRNRRSNRVVLFLGSWAGGLVSLNTYK